MQDNKPVHIAQIIYRLLKELGVNTMIWPPYSPDLNPIKNLWAIMKAKIYEIYPYLENTPNNKETLEALIQAAKEAWDAIKEHILQHLCTTIPYRIEAVILADGWYTKY
jgi:transposase